MQIAQKVAGYTLGQADLLRRAMGKKKLSELEKAYAGFRQGMLDNGFSEAAIKALWEAVLPFAGYAYNKSHAAGYSLVMYWTAYLKANYPAEYMAGLLTSVGDDKDKIAVYLADCRTRGIVVLPPDVNASRVDFASVGADIRFGLGAVRNVGTNVVASIVRAREEKSKYTDFSDYLNKIDTTACSKKVTESLIKSGAFDSLDHPRKGLMLIHADAIDSVMGTKKAESIGQFDLFGGEDTDEAIMSVFNIKVPDEEWDAKHKLALEREMLGLYVSGHPLDGIAASLTSKTDTSIAAVHAGKVRHGQKIKIGGIVAAVDRRVNKKGEPWAIVEIADLDAATEILVFSSTYSSFQHVLTEDSILLVTANVSIREGRTSVVAVDICVPELGNADPSLSPVTLTLPVHSCTRPNIEALRETLQRHPGNTDVHIALTGTTTTRWATDPMYRVHKTPALYGDLKALFGANCLATSPPGAANA